MDVICMDYLFQLGFIKKTVGEVDRGFKREYRKDTIAFGAKIVQFWKLQLHDLAAKLGEFCEHKLLRQLEFAICWPVAKKTKFSSC